MSVYSDTSEADEVPELTEARDISNPRDARHILWGIQEHLLSSIDEIRDSIREADGAPLNSSEVLSIASLRSEFRQSWRWHEEICERVRRTYADKVKGSEWNDGYDLDLGWMLMETKGILKSMASFAEPNEFDELAAHVQAGRERERSQLEDQLFLAGSEPTFLVLSESQSSDSSYPG